MKKHLLLTFFALFCFALPVSAQGVGGDGLHKQPWFYASFLDLNEDLAEAKAQGKDLLILIEQAGCPYCKELHEVNFTRPEIVDYIKAHYLVVQLDLYGSRMTTDFDGQELEERQLVQKWGAHFTPTTVIFAARRAPANSFDKAALFSLPGYLKPFHYMTALEYATSGATEEQSFQRFLKAKILDLESRGVKPEVW